MGTQQAFAALRKRTKKETAPSISDQLIANSYKPEAERGAVQKRGNRQAYVSTVSQRFGSLPRGLVRRNRSLPASKARTIGARQLGRVRTHPHPAGPQRFVKRQPAHRKDFTASQKTLSATSQSGGTMLLSFFSPSEATSIVRSFVGMYL
jgi:hypothetical protein